MSGAGNFTLMSRQWCHLCHDMLDELKPLAGELGWSVEVFDVDADPVLEARWNELVPVLLAGDQVLCNYHLDEAAVRAYCASAASARESG